jgi:hypothetical protein
MRKRAILACVVCAVLSGCNRSRPSDEFKIIEFHSEGEFDGYCYVTAQRGSDLLYARSVQGEQWDCNYLMVELPVRRLIRQGYFNEELQVHIDMSGVAPLVSSGKPPKDFDEDFFIYGGRQREYTPVNLGPKAAVENLPKCKDVPDSQKALTPCRDEAGILNDPSQRSTR